MAWKKIELEKDWWNPVNLYDGIEGILIEIKEEEFNRDLVKVYILEVKPLNKPHRFIRLPNHTLLMSLLSNVNIGQRIKIEYLGELPSKNINPLKNYNLWVWEQE